MVDTVLDVCCDCAAAPHSTVAVGAGWARVTLRGPCGQIADLPRALRMLTVASGVSGTPVVRVSGPDAPADPAPLRREALRAWAAHCAAAGAAAGVAAASDADAGAGAAGAAGAGGDAAAQMAARVAAHARRHGAAPDFAAARVAARGKVCNYIRSTSGNPFASDELVEAVRCHLAAAP